MIRSVFRLLLIPVKLFTGLVLVFVLLRGLRFSLFINAILSIQVSDLFLYLKKIKKNKLHTSGCKHVNDLDNCKVILCLPFTVIGGLGMGVVEVHSVAYFSDQDAQSAQMYSQ